MGHFANCTPTFWVEDEEDDRELIQAVISSLENAIELHEDLQALARVNPGEGEFLMRSFQIQAEDVMTTARQVLHR